MVKKRYRVLDALVALVLALLLFGSAFFLADQVKHSKVLTQSRVFRSFMKDDAVHLDFKSLLEDSAQRKAVERFIVGLTDAYISFELIPYNEGSTFTTVMNAWVDGMEINDFIYHGKDLEIRGTVENEAQYETFIQNLEESHYFEDVSGFIQEKNGIFLFSVTGSAEETVYPKIFTPQ